MHATTSIPPSHARIYCSTFSSISLLDWLCERIISFRHYSSQQKLMILLWKLHSSYRMLAMQWKRRNELIKYITLITFRALMVSVPFQGVLFTATTTIALLPNHIVVRVNQFTSCYCSILVLMIPHLHLIDNFRVFHPLGFIAVLHVLAKIIYSFYSNFTEYSIKHGIVSSYY